MYRIRELGLDTDHAAFCQVPEAPIAPDLLLRQRPDALLLVHRSGEAIVARCALWWSATPAHLGQRTGLIGHYFASDPAAAHALLERACADLGAQGCALAVGPMDGSTWGRYRLITERRTEPPFFLEPDNPDAYPDHFQAAGFTPLAQYYSACATDLDVQDERIPHLTERLTAQGIHLRALNLDHFEEELRRLHALSVISFASNFLYTPISVEDFLTQYRPLRPHLHSELIFLAEQQGHLVGFLFAIPDLLQAQRGKPIDTVIAKTMAVHPDHAGVGLGSVLMARCHQQSLQSGYRRVIHALFHEANRSGNISRHTAEVIRRYTLFARPVKGTS